MCFIGVKFMPRHITVSQEKWWCLGNKTTTSLQHLLHNRIISFLALGFYKHSTELYKKHRNKINSLENPSWDLPDLQWQPVWASTETPAPIVPQVYPGNSGELFPLALILLEEDTTKFLLGPPGHTWVAPNSMKIHNHTEATNAGCAHDPTPWSQFSEVWDLNQLCCAQAGLNISC